MHNNSLELFRIHAVPLMKRGMKVLEIGPDPEWECLKLLRSEVYDLDYHYADLTNVDRGGQQVLMVNEYRLDCPIGTFDVVFSCNVIEHVKSLWRWLAEQVRVTKSGGLIMCVNPVSWPYHECPIDCWRIYPEGYRALFTEVGLEEVLSKTESLLPIEARHLAEHGDRPVVDTIAIGRRR